jgi:2-polyprenyl-6-methoxyphenol hydroxylase-like FAD-dependent oxidoreductase
MMQLLHRSSSSSAFVAPMLGRILQPIYQHLLLFHTNTATQTTTLPPVPSFSSSTTATTPKRQHWPVVIVGAGPTGLTTALLLSKYNVPCLVLEKSPSLTTHPQAHFINHRTMEVFRSLKYNNTLQLSSGHSSLSSFSSSSPPSPSSPPSYTSLASEIEELMPPLSEWRRFIYCCSMVGGSDEDQVFGTVDHFPGQIDSSRNDLYSPEPVAHLSQNRLLPLLSRRVVEEAPGVELRMGHKVVGFRQSPSEQQQQQQQQHSSRKRPIELKIERKVELGNISSSNSSNNSNNRGGVSSSPSSPPLFPSKNSKATTESVIIEADWVVAADGARGGLREVLGIEMSTGPGAMQHLINIHFSSPQLGKMLQQSNRQGMLYFAFNSSVIVVMVAHDIGAGEFVAQVPFFPPLQSVDSDFTVERCSEIVRAAAGVDDLSLEVKQVRPWTMGAKVADTYVDGHAILAGDAAHVVPPSGAFGMNTGIQDAHNLAWKLAAVIHGQAAPELVTKTYEMERRPVALANMQLSVDNFYEALNIPRTLGLDFLTANAVSDLLSSPALRWAPQDFRKAALDAAMSAGKKGAAAVAPFRRAAIKEIFVKGNTLRLQYPKEDLGFLYRHGAVVHSDKKETEEVVEYQRRQLMREAPYQPTTLPGARFPHFLVEPLSSSVQVKEGQVGTSVSLSSLDLIAAAGCKLVVFISSSSAYEKWISAAQSVNNRKRGEEVILSLVQIITDTDTGNISCGKEHKVTQLRDVNSVWKDLRGVGDDGAVLVRPDGHVAWRSRDGGGIDQLESAVSSILLSTL